MAGMYDAAPAPPCAQCAAGLAPNVVAALVAEEAFGKCDQRSAQWYAQRNGKLTASDMDAVLNYSPFSSPEMVADKKCGMGAPRDAATPPLACKWGIDHEDEACERYMHVTGHKVVFFGILPHPEHWWLAGSPDGVTACGRLLEIKCPWSRKITPVMPKCYEAQVRLLQDIFKCEFADFVQYRPAGHGPKGEKVIGRAEELQITEVAFDASWGTTDRRYERCREFMVNVVAMQGYCQSNPFCTEK